MAGTTLERPAASVPALVNTPALEIEASDIALPALKIGHFSSTPCQDGRVTPGALFTSLGDDDPEPAELWVPPKGGEAKEKSPLLFHVLGMRKGLSYSEQGGDLEMWQFGDPNAHPDSWTTYNYFVCLPEVDQEVPYKFLLTKTKAAAAKQINYALMKSAASGPPWNVAFTVKTAGRENSKGKYFVPLISVVEASKSNVEIAERLAIMVSGKSADVQATGEEPAI